MLSWALQASRHIDDGWRMRSRFLIAAVRERSLARRLSELDPSSPLGRLTAEWPQTVGTLIFPYQCARWDAKQRFARLTAHLDAIATIPGLQLAPDNKLLIADLSPFSEDASLILERLPFMAMEGHLTLSLFKGSFRAFTVTFSLRRGERGLELFIGSIQGRQSETALDLYRAVTKDLYGVRPRDFMLEALRMFAQVIGVKTIHAVANAHKITEHPLFRKVGLPAAYDQVWEERGGVRVAETHWELPVSPNRRNLDEVPSKKRSMYRQRYEMFDAIMASMPRDLTEADRKHFEAE